MDDREDTRPLAVFEKGDKVIIVDGDLKELTGRVIGKEEDGKVIVMPEMQDLNEALTFDAAQLSKFFVAGDHVKVCFPQLFREPEALSSPQVVWLRLWALLTSHWHAYSQCINGKHTGNTGMVVKSENGICVVFSDMTQKEFRVFARDLSESQEVATGEDKIGDHDLHDLVVLDHQTVGVIVHVEKDSCRVLTNQVLRLSQTCS